MADGRVFGWEVGVAEDAEHEVEDEVDDLFELLDICRAGAFCCDDWEVGTGESLDLLMLFTKSDLASCS